MKIFIQIGVALAFVSVVPHHGLAQGISSPRSTGGLFGGGSSGAGKRGGLAVMLDVSGKRESTVPPRLQGFVPVNGLQAGGLSSMAVGSAAYARNRRRLQLAASALTAFEYYGSLNRVNPVSHAAGLSAAVQVSRQGKLQFDQKAAYSPSYLYQLFPTVAPPAPGESIPTNPEYRIDSTPSISYSSGMGLTLGSPGSMQVKGAADYGDTRFERDELARPKLRTYGASARLSRGLSRKTAVSAEYKYGIGEQRAQPGSARSEFTLGTRTTDQSVAIGFEYTPALSRSRRATVRVNVTPAMMILPSRNVPLTSESELERDRQSVSATSEERLYRLHGDATFDYPFRANWRAAVTYSRGFEYLALLSEPVLSEGTHAEVHAVVARKVDVSALAGYAIAGSAFLPETRPLKTYTGDVRITTALTASLAVYSDYSYYYFDLREQSRLVPDLPPVFGQHTARVGLTLTSSLFGR